MHKKRDLLFLKSYVIDFWIDDFKSVFILKILFNFLKCINGNFIYYNRTLWLFINHKYASFFANLMLHSMIHHYCTIHRNKSYIGIRTFHSTQWLEHHFCRNLYIKEFFWAGCLDSFLCCWKLSHNYFLTIIVTKNLRTIPRKITIKRW